MELISLKKDLVCVQRCTLGAKESGGVEILISGVRGGNKKKLQILSQTRLHVDCVLWQETPIVVFFVFVTCKCSHQTAVKYWIVLQPLHHPLNACSIKGRFVDVAENMRRISWQATKFMTYLRHTHSRQTNKPARRAAVKELWNRGAGQNCAFWFHKGRSHDLQPLFE